MSARSFRRAQARRAAAQQRRALLRRRRELTAGILGATALMAGPAHAALVVNLTTDGAPSTCDVTCTLRDAITDANANPGNDVITFAPAVTGTIRLTQGELPISSDQGLTITGPGRAALTVSGDKDNSGTANAGDSRIFDVQLPTSTSPGAGVTISGLTLTNGFDPSGGNAGGAIFDNGSAALTIADSAITNSISLDNGGGLVKGGSGALTISGTTISGNTAVNGGGITANNTDGTFKLVDSTVSGNHATGNPNSAGGGVRVYGDTTVIDHTTISGNTAAGSAGGIYGDPKYGLTITNSTVSGNSAPSGGGMSLTTSSAKYAFTRISDTTVSGNQGDRGAGIAVQGVDTGDRLTIARSTISGNAGGATSWGGGILFDAFNSGVIDVVDSTLSGNSAMSGGAISFGSDTNFPVLVNGPYTGSIDVHNSTIAGNTAAAHGGGIYLSQYDAGSPSAKKSATPTITSTIVAGNTAAGAPQDLDRVDTSTAGGIVGAFSLVQTQGDGLLTQQSMLLGVDPQLGPFGDHGGPTATMVPAGTSPAIDQGRSADKLTIDQLNGPRLVDTLIPNAPNGGDGTDIGAIELAADQVPPPPKAALAVTVRGKSVGSGTLLLPASLLPLNCTVTVVSMTACNIELRATRATKLRASLPKNTLLAEGSATSASGVGQLNLKVKLTRDGKAVLKRQPVGVTAAVVATAPTDVSSALTASGAVHLLAGPSVTLKLGKQRTKLPKTVNKQLDQLAKLIQDAKTITCTAPAKKQAQAACKRLAKDGVGARATTKTKRRPRSVVVKFTL
jgi:hypothetical protein